MTNFTCGHCQTTSAIDTDSVTFTPDADTESARIECPACGKEITIAKPASQGFGGGNAT